MVPKTGTLVEMVDHNDISDKTALVLGNRLCREVLYSCRGVYVHIQHATKLPSSAVLFCDRAV